MKFLSIKFNTHLLLLMRCEATLISCFIVKMCHNYHIYVINALFNLCYVLTAVLLWCKCVNASKIIIFRH